MMRPPMLHDLAFLNSLDYFLTQFRWKVILHINRILKPRQQMVLYDEMHQGFMVFAFLQTDTPEVEVTLDLSGDGSIEARLSPKFLYEVGAVNPNNVSAYLTVYDPDNNNYVAMYTPSPWLPFMERVRVTLLNPRTDKEAKLTFTAWLLVKQ